MKLLKPETAPLDAVRQLSTEEVCIRPLIAGDGVFMSQVYNSPGAQSGTTGAILTPEKAEEMIKEYGQTGLGWTRSTWFMACEVVKPNENSKKRWTTGNPIGIVGFSFQSWPNGNAVSEMYMHPDFRGKGLGPMVKFLALDYLFTENRHFNSVSARVRQSNEKSIISVQKSGYAWTGIEIGSVRVNPTEHEDQLVFTITRRYFLETIKTHVIENESLPKPNPEYCYEKGKVSIQIPEGY